MPNSLPDNSTPELLAQLLRRVASHDTIALDALYTLTAPKLFGIALQMLGRREWAEEVMQDTFAAVWGFAAEYQAGESVPMAWMAAIVRKRALDILRSQRSTGTGAVTSWDANLDELLTSNAAGPLERVASGQEARWLAVAMQELEASQRRAITLAFFCELTHGEVAETMNVPLGTAKSWIRRGLQTLKFDLDEAGASGALHEER